MLIEYINEAMNKAVYDKLEDGSFSGKIPECPGVIAFGKKLFQCQKELESSLEGWLIVKIRHGSYTLTLPNNKEYSVPQIKMLISEIEDGTGQKISFEEWENA